jgi:predicted lysophospholipase L1 biosynthesis ABC-type transport system permease subunit
VAIPSFFFSFSRPGKGMVVSLAAIRRIQPGSLSQGVGAFVRYADGVATAKAEAAIQRRVQHVFILGTETSGSVRNLSGVGSVPLLLAGILAAMAAMTLAHTLITSIRRRRLDLAILKTLGFVRHQVSAAVAWQATTLGAVAVLIGLPLGVVAGRWGWNVFADRLGVVREPVIPFATVLIAIPATLLVANLLAVIPGRIASRLKAAPVLRAE